MPPGAIYVGRRTRWGNPFRVIRQGWIEIGEGEGDLRPLVTWTKPALPEDRADVVMLYREWLDQPAQTELRAAIARELRGNNLCCWCPPGPCHADVLLEIANA